MYLVETRILAGGSAVVRRRLARWRLVRLIELSAAVTGIEWTDNRRQWLVTSRSRRWWRRRRRSLCLWWHL